MSLCLKISGGFQALMVGFHIIRDRFIHGLREKDLTADQVYEMVQAAEATAEQIMHIMSGNRTVSTVKVGKYVVGIL